MGNNPYGKEQFAKQWTPRLVTTVYGIWNTSHYTYQVDNKDRSWRDEKRSPFKHIKLCKVPILIRCLRSDSKVGIDPSKHFQQTLEDSKEMSWCATNDPELFIPPPVFNTNTTPSQLKNSSSENRNEEENEPHASKVTYLPNNVNLIIGCQDE